MCPACVRHMVASLSAAGAGPASPWPRAMPPGPLAQGRGHRRQVLCSVKTRGRRMAPWVAVWSQGHAQRSGWKGQWGQPPVRTRAAAPPQLCDPATGRMRLRARAEGHLGVHPQEDEVTWCPLGTTASHAAVPRGHPWLGRTTSRRPHTGPHPGKTPQARKVLEKRNLFVVKP